MIKHGQKPIVSGPKVIGCFIADLRERQGFTQKSFAYRLGTTQSAVARMERGQQNFSTEMLTKIGKVLGRNVISLDSGRLNFRVEGGRSLSGTVTTNTSKNSAVALLCASLINRQKTILRSMPRVDDVYSVIKILKSIGARVNWLNESDIEITVPTFLKLEKIDCKEALKTRSTLLLIGAVLSRSHEFTIPHAGGCKLGARTIRPHLFALEELGIRVKSAHDCYEVTASAKKPAEVVLYESSDTATENAIMAASAIPGKTIIKYASPNYMVQELCHYLSSLGVKFEGAGTTTLTVHGDPKLSKQVEYRISEDPVETMLFLAIAAVTRSAITIKRCPVDFLELELLKLKKMGFKFKLSPKYKAANGITDLVDIQTFPSRLAALEEKIHPQPFPGLNIDNLPFFVPIATQAKGTTLIHDWVYENRALYYMELEKLGAKLRLADPHRVFVDGPAELRAAEIVCPPALRPAAIILIAMLAARGTSILRNVYSINRGYENLCERLQKLGAKIEIFSDL